MENKHIKNIVIATGNPHKLEEINAINKYDDINFSLVEGEFNPVENGKDFNENAYIKAAAAAKMMKTYCLADDSGLCVNTLNGAPGLHSARYAGTQSEKIKKILTELKDVPFEKRDAFFVSIMMLVDKDGQIIHSTQGRVDGYIIDTAKGSNGFGFDPVFFIPEYNKTMAEMDSKLKNSVSHRAKSLNSMLEWINKNL